MNKEQLIKLKKILEQGKQKYSVIYMKNREIINEDEILLELNELEEKPKTQEAIQAITNEFEKIMRFLAANDQEFNEISIIPNFGILVKEKDLDFEKGIIKENAEYLNDTAVVDFYEVSIKNDGVELEENELTDSLLKNFEKIYKVSVKDFIIGLAGEGFELEGINTFEDIKNNSKGKITIQFNKEKQNTL